MDWKTVVTIQLVTKLESKFLTLKDLDNALETDDAKVMYRSERPVPVPLTMLEVLNIGLLGHGMEVRLPNGETALLIVPETEREKVSKAIKAAI
jgi:hypothetical protein